MEILQTAFESPHLNNAAAMSASSAFISTSSLGKGFVHMPFLSPPNHNMRGMDAVLGVKSIWSMSSVESCSAWVSPACSTKCTVQSFLQCAHCMQRFSWQCWVGVYRMSPVGGLGQGGHWMRVAAAVWHATNSLVSQLSDNSTN